MIYYLNSPKTRLTLLLFDKLGKDVRRCIKKTNKLIENLRGGEQYLTL